MQTLHLPLNTPIFQNILLLGTKTCNILVNYNKFSVFKFLSTAKNTVCFLPDWNACKLHGELLFASFVCADTVQNRKIICRLLTNYDQTFDVLKCGQTSVNYCKIVNRNFARIKFKNIYHMCGWFPIFQFCADEIKASRYCAEKNFPAHSKDSSLAILPY